MSVLYTGGESDYLDLFNFVEVISDLLPPFPFDPAFFHFSSRIVQDLFNFTALSLRNHSSEIEIKSPVAISTLA